jgi:molecular chaperone IbpA
MRTSLDFSPLYRSSIGFDRLFSLLENADQAVDHWPPYDIVRTGEDSYRIVMAVAGFRSDDLSITRQPNLLVVAGAKPGEAREDRGEYLHRGIAGRAFERRFELADHVEVTAASLENGLLSIALKRELPEAMKPRRIAINDARAEPPAGPEAPRIENKAA